MKKYMIEVVPKFEKNPTDEEFENICDSIVDAVDNYCNNQERSFHVTFPFPICVCIGNTDNYKLIDGYHRYAANRDKENVDIIVLE